MSTHSSDDDVIGIMQSACNEAWDQLDNLLWEDEAITVLKRFCLRVHGFAQLILRLQEEWSDIFESESIILLRPAYDACIQSLYLASNPSKACERAIDYLTFSDLERAKLFDDAKKLNSDFARMAFEPPNINAEARLAVACEAAKKRFRLPGKSGCHKEWYRSTFEALAANVGYSDEHFFMVRLLNKAIHSSPFTEEFGTVMDPRLVRFASLVLNCRTLCATVSYARLALSTRTTKVFEFARGLYPQFW